MKRRDFLKMFGIGHESAASNRTSIACYTSKESLTPDLLPGKLRTIVEIGGWDNG